MEHLFILAMKGSIIIRIGCMLNLQVCLFNLSKPLFDKRKVFRSDDHVVVVVVVDNDDDNNDNDNIHHFIISSSFLVPQPFVYFLYRSSYPRRTSF